MWRMRIRAAVVLTGLLAGLAGAARIPTQTNEFRASGIVEGFFGPPYSFTQRRALFLFAARAGLNTYIYAPKNDAFHRQQWRDPYPPDHLDHFRELVTLGADAGVRFVYAISPGLDFDPAADDLAVLVQKLESIRAVGVRDFCVFFDDVFGAMAGADPAVQADAVIGVRAALRASDPSISLCFISQFYEGTAEQLATDSSRLGSLYPDHTSSEAYAAYARIPTDVPIMWTGPAVFTDRLTVSEAMAFRTFAGRPVLLWDNYPVNDGLVANDIFLGPYSGREPGLEAALDGILVNPMLKPEATEIPLWTIGRALAFGAAYDPEAASAEALRLAVNDNRRALRPLAILTSHFQSHPVIGDTPESAELAAAVEAFFVAPGGRTRRALTHLFRTYAKNHARLTRELGRAKANPALLTELQDASQKLALLGEAGLLALDLLKRHERGATVDTAAFVAKIAEADAIRWFLGKNLMAPAFADLIAERPPSNVDVFGGFFERVLAALGD